MLRKQAKILPRQQLCSDLSIIYLHTYYLNILKPFRVSVSSLGLFPGAQQCRDNTFFFLPTVVHPYYIHLQY